MERSKRTDNGSRSVGCPEAGKSRDQGGSASRKRRLGTAGNAVLLVAVLLTAACSNFITGDNLKDAIQDAANEANAASVDVTISATPSAGGTLSLSGLVTGKKVGVPFSLTAYPDTDYVFSGWTASTAGNVTFGNPSSATTSVTIGAKASDITITANFTARPYVKSISPYTGTTGVYKNQPIVVTFSKAMSTSSFEAAGNIVVTAESGSTVYTLFTSGSASSVFTYAPNSSNTALILTPKQSSTILIGGVPTAVSGGYMPSSYRIYVTVSSAVTDAAGHAMSEGYD